jgi:murein DD-endopeptidase MepM/ murein hydrolase activator NlpD
MPTNPITGSKLPAAGPLSFGYQRSPTHRHNGIDIPAAIGTLVRAAHSGLVLYATHEWQQGFTGYGRVVVIANDDNTWNLYAHLDEPLVQAGEPVREGDPIGRVGTTQFSAPEHTSHLHGPHLHFEVSETPYPQPSTAPRLDTIAWLEGRAARERPIPFGATSSQSTTTSQTKTSPHPHASADRSAPSSSSQPSQPASPSSSAVEPDREITTVTPRGGSK